MKRKCISLILSLFILSSCKGQSQEQKDDFEDIKAQDAKYKVEQKQKANFQAQKTKITTQSHLARYKITKSTIKKFDNWEHDMADIFLVTIAYNSRNNKEYKIGTIQANGSFNLSMPESANPDKEINIYFGCVNGYSGAKTIYTNPLAKIIRTYISIKKNGKQIGMLNMATSKEQIAENSLMDDYYGIPGYTLQWWYANKETSAKASCSKNKIGAAKINNVYDINFKQGWNLVKTEFLGERVKGNGRSYYKIQKHTVIPTLSDNIRWVFN